MHADHHLGLLTVLKLRQTFEEEVSVIGPSSLRDFLNEYSALVGPLKYKWIDMEVLDPSNRVVKFSFGEITIVPVYHSESSFAAVVFISNL